MPHKRVVRAAVIVVVSLWASEFLFLAISQHVRGTSLSGRALLQQLLTTLLGIGFSALLATILFSRRSWSVWIRVAVTSASAILFSIVASGIGLVSHDVLVAEGMGYGRITQVLHETMVGSFVFWLRIFISGAGAMLALTYAMDVDVAEKERSASLEMANRAALAALSYQIRPHFLFNILNGLAALVRDGEASKAEAAILNLSDYVRAILNSEAVTDIPLGAEFSHATQYLELEAIRFAERLRWTISLEPDIQDLLVPPLIVQPLIENSIKHAVAQTLDAVTIVLSAKCIEGELVLCVSDDGGGQTGETNTSLGLGLGLDIVRRRLAARYGDAASLAVERDGRGFVSTVVVRQPKS